MLEPETPVSPTLQTPTLHALVLPTAVLLAPRLEALAVGWLVWLTETRHLLVMW
jgi:hypothetical protein